MIFISKPVQMLPLSLAAEFIIAAAMKADMMEFTPFTFRKVQQFVIKKNTMGKERELVQRF